MLADESLSWTGALVTMVGVGALLVGGGWLVIVVAERAADGRLGRNGWAGIRTRTTRSSDAAWLAAHRASRDLTVRGGQVGVVTGALGTPIAVAFGSGDTERALTIWSAVTGLGVAVLAALVIAAAVRGQRAARHASADHR